MPMSFKEKCKKWFKDFAEEGAAETMTEIAIDQLPPVLILSWICYGCLLAGVVFGFVGWYFATWHVVSYTISAIAGFVGVVLYLVRMFVVSRLSGLLLKGYRHLRTTTQSEPDKTNPPSS
ncbi:MAG: hypothetical protein QG625_1219 [Cyanobacteriota bacterium erpe_2018_sw_39hr_WHONDRS-SW48-000098_B_bin.30]|jgi:hypothetical protein|nr:hypothetical protein [Cyanobacteriota bacterium erpe_2018_sw_39hr_WHONDRS-SW48-000098_B_bin.30]